MANEIRVQAALTVNNGNQSFSKSTSYSADQSSAGGPSNGVQNIGTAYEAVNVADVTSKGFVLFTNLDGTNFVEIGVEVSAAFYPFVKLLAGESAVLRLSPSVALFAKADTAAVNLESYVFEA